MKRTGYLILILCFCVMLTFGQKLAKPSQMPVAPTEAQQRTIQEGVSLHDAKKYDDAIAKYRSVLAENPDCTTAMYELAMTQYAKGDKSGAMETAYRGSKYISDELALFYQSIASCLDDVGKPDEAMKIFHDAEEILRSYPNMKDQLSSVQYNMGVTLVRQKKYNDARSALKSAVQSNYSYASPHYLLSIVYNGTNYRLPALLVASRFVALEYSSNRTGNAAAIVADVLKPASKDPKTGNININLNLNDPKDEGDFGTYSFLLPTLMTIKDEKDKNKTENELFVDALGTVIALLDEDTKLKSTFVGKNYVPFMVEMKRNGYVEVFGYMVRYITGHNDAMDWLKAHDEKLGKFFAWAKAYRLPA